MAMFYDPEDEGQYAGAPGPGGGMVYQAPKVPGYSSPASQYDSTGSGIQYAQGPGGGMVGYAGKDTPNPQPMGTNPETAMRWAQADMLKPGTPGYAKAQSGLEGWISSQIAQAQASGQLNPNDHGALASYLSTLGVTPQKGGGKFLYNKIMQGGVGALAKAQVNPADMGRQALSQKYGSDLSLGGMMGSPDYSGDIYG